MIHFRDFNLEWCDIMEQNSWGISKATCKALAIHVWHGPPSLSCLFPALSLRISNQWTSLITFIQAHFWIPHEEHIWVPGKLIKGNKYETIYGDVSVFNLSHLFCWMQNNFFALSFLDCRRWHRQNWQLGECIWTQLGNDIISYSLIDKYVLTWSMS